MHVLLAHTNVIPVHAYGGTERVVWDLGRALVERGHRVTFLVAAGSHCDFADVRVLRKRVPLREQIPQGVDVVHTQFDPGDLAGLPWVYTEHGNAPAGTVLPLNTVFVSRNHAARHQAQAHVLNGLDWDAYGPVDLEGPRSHVHFLGRARWDVKNVQGAIDVAHAAGVTLDVLGGYRFNFKRGVRLTWSRSIRFHGMVGGARKLALLGASRGLVFPVVWDEPFGLAVIESLYFGCPVFATPYGSLPELVPQACGVLSASREVLAEAIASGRFDRRECHERVVGQFSAGRMADDYLRLYQRVMGGESLNAAPPVGPFYERLPWN